VSYLFRHGFRPRPNRIATMTANRQNDGGIDRRSQMKGVVDFWVKRGDFVHPAAERLRSSWGSFRLKVQRKINWEF
jgi:hypothetical protein